MASQHKDPLQALCSTVVRFNTNTADINWADAAWATDDSIVSNKKKKNLRKHTAGISRNVERLDSRSIQMLGNWKS